MAFGVKREELKQWKQQVRNGQVAFLTHYWLDDRFPDAKTVTKAGCADREKLIKWGAQYGLREAWIDEHGDLPHFDLIGDYQRRILQAEQQFEQLERFGLTHKKKQ
jgi:hypothetical protein